MANIGATTAFYKVETSLTRANNEVSKSMERLATGKQNANAGDRSSYAAMADTFRLDYVGTKAGIKGASVVMGYLETGMRVWIQQQRYSLDCKSLQFWVQTTQIH